MSSSQGATEPREISAIERGSGSTKKQKRTGPEIKKVPVEFTFNPSEDGVNENLLVLLHGLGK